MGGMGILWLGAAYLTTSVLIGSTALLHLSFLSLALLGQGTLAGWDGYAVLLQSCAKPVKVEWLASSAWAADGSKLG